jgi:hypothetical protein
MHEVVMVHLLKNGFGLHVSQGQVLVGFLWHQLSQFDAGVPLFAPSSHSSPGSIWPSPQRGGFLSQKVHVLVQLLDGVPFIQPSSHSSGNSTTPFPQIGTLGLPQLSIQVQLALQ